MGRMKRLLGILTRIFDAVRRLMLRAAEVRPSEGGATEGPVRLLRRARRRPRRLRPWRRAPEPQPLEQALKMLAPGVYSHEPPPSAAARTNKDVDGEHCQRRERLAHASRIGDRQDLELHALCALLLRRARPPRAVLRPSGPLSS